jgi:hypothetical protein
VATRIPHRQLVLESQQVTNRRARYYNQVKCRFRPPGSHIGVDEPQPLANLGRGVTLPLHRMFEHFSLFLQANYLEAQARALLS